MSAKGHGMHGRLFGLLLHLYPAAFRAQYGAEMMSFFVQRLERARKARGVAGVVGLWFSTTVDVMSTAFAERRNTSSGRIATKGPTVMSALLQDIRYAGRRLRQTPLFTLSAVVILAVGIGLNATVFSLVDAILLRPPPFTDPSSIVHIHQHSDDGDPRATAFPAYRDMAAMTDVFTGVAATSSGDATWESAEGPRQVSVEWATASLFPVLGVQPYRGRWFSPEHDHAGGEMVAVVTHRAWRTLMSSDPDVVGRTIRLNNQPVTIIGIGPEGFNGEGGALLTHFWLSISSTPVGGPFRVTNLERREDHWYLVKARLAPGVSVERARVAMNELALHLGEVYPDVDRGRGITVFAHGEVRLHPDLDKPLLAVGIGLFTVAGLVLLLACSNLANLLLARGMTRGPEMALRLALGAGRVRVMRLMLVEALLLSAVGAAAGLGLAALTLRVVPTLPLPIPGGGGLDAGFDHRVVVFAALLALATGLLFGLLPALRATRGDVAASLREEGRGRSSSRSVSLVRGGLVAVQVAVSMLLIVGAGLFARSLSNASSVDPGFDAPRLAVLGTSLQQGGVSDDESAVVAAQVLERVAALPGVERVALTSRLPVQSGPTTTQVVDGYVPTAGTASVELNFATVSRDYFETVGMRLLQGRGFTEDDRPGSPRVIVVNETAARRYWNGNAIGGRIRAQSAPDAWREVVGVVADSRVTSLDEAPTPMVYYAAEQTGVSSFMVVARTPGEPAALLPPLRGALLEVRPTLPVTRLATMDAHLGDALAGARMITVLISTFSLLALLLASLGIYAVVSFAVERRSQELGIRSALGAGRSRLVGAVVGETLLVVALGLVLGLALAALTTRGLESVLFGVSSFDAATFGAAAVLLLAAAGTAALVPALRAARTDPVQVLRRV